MERIHLLVKALYADYPTVKPAASLIPYQSIAFISSSNRKPATAVSNVGNVEGNPTMGVTGKQRREVPLPSQEGKKGVMQYAL